MRLIGSKSSCRNCSYPSDYIILADGPERTHFSNNECVYKYGKFYEPSDNLEFLEWKYDESLTTI